MLEKHETQDNRDCLNGALISGGIASLQAAAVSGGLYYLALKHSPFFRQASQPGGSRACMGPSRSGPLEAPPGRLSPPGSTCSHARTTAVQYLRGAPWYPPPRGYSRPSRGSLEDPASPASLPTTPTGHSALTQCPGACAAWQSIVAGPCVAGGGAAPSPLPA
jgi:hypothetical protein